MALGSDADRLRWYGSAEGVAAADAYLDALVAEAPPLAEWQVTRLRALGLTLRAAPSNTEPTAVPQPHAMPPVSALLAPDATEVQAA